MNEIEKLEYKLLLIAHYKSQFYELRPIARSVSKIMQKLVDKKAMKFAEQQALEDIKKMTILKKIHFWQIINKHLPYFTRLM